MKKPGFTTATLHSDRSKPIEHGATHKPIHNSAAFCYADANELVKVFQGEKAGFVYGRQGSPTSAALEDKITRMEDGLATISFSSGMAAISTTLFALLRAGDHMVASSFLFGNTTSLFETFAQFGIEVTFVDPTEAANVEAALKPNTRVVFVETIANPRTQVADLAGIGAVCQARNVLYVVDNTITTPFLFQPKRVCASLVINSLTKYIGGHGNALGGAVTDTGLFDWSTYPNIYDHYKKGETKTWGVVQIRKKGLRDAGATLGPEAAHHLAIGAETLALRMQRTCSNAQRLAEFLAAHPKVKRVYYPGLSDHPQYERAKSLFCGNSGILSFELIDGIDCIAALGKLEIVISSTNLGDNRTLAIPVAPTIYFEMGAERRASLGIAESLIRISTGIEDIEDLIADFTAALAD
ncbi:cystathionine gamma-synthase family protein [Propionivibrio limicola]|uniref:cystathionine gamma-synthase family protein n=1 Tax=Propionivibrio limicola TaxID=167645 RepID=UPI001290F8A8|nr:cystathionine gamma-synthase family protein [Propionivibrio limicola]